MKEKMIVAAVLTMLLFGTILTIVPIQASPDPIKIGIIGPHGLPHYSPAGMKEAAEIARDEINDEGGVHVGGDTYRDIELVFENEYSYPSISIPDAQAAIGNLYTAGCRVVIGGFRTEVTGPMIETAMTQLEPIIFLINGASTNELISDRVPVNYEKYKYLFRVNPVNSTALLMTVGGGVQYLAAKMMPLFGCENGNTQISVAVLTEDLDWTLVIHQYLTNPAIYPAVLGPYVNVTYSSRIPAYPEPASTKPWLDAANATKARILLHIFSAPIGRKLILEWAAYGHGAGTPYTYMPVGINVMGQLQDHWNPQPPWPPAPGACEYESVLNFVGTRTPITPEAVEFWDDFVTKTGGIWPLYTAFGAYDAIYGVKEAIEASGVVPEAGWAPGGDETLPSAFVTSMEATNRMGLNARFKYTPYHDVFCNSFGPFWPSTQYVRAMMAQWLSGYMDVVCPIDQTYSKDWNIPPWMYPYVTDINYDGIVEGRDLYGVAKCYGQEPGDPRWDQRTDVVSDDIVEGRDLYRVAKDYGDESSLPICPDP